MKGLGAFQISQMKHRDARIAAMCQHLRDAIDLWEQIAREPFKEPESRTKESRDQVVCAPPAAPPVAAPAEKLTYSIREAAGALGVGRSTLYKALSEGTLSALKLGNRTLIPAETLRTWMNSWAKR